MPWYYDRDSGVLYEAYNRQSGVPREDGSVVIARYRLIPTSEVSPIPRTRKR